MHTSLKKSCTVGTITSIENHGIIVLVAVNIEAGENLIIPFDHTPFRWLLEGEACSPTGLLGRSVEFDGETIAFLD